jgi:glycosyltransferase involved in cell wall biosynthesis
VPNALIQSARLRSPAPCVFIPVLLCFEISSRLLRYFVRYYVKYTYMKFSIIIPVYNTSAYLERCIRAVKSMDFPADEYEILAVDNNSTDGSLEILSKIDGIRILREEKQGSYAARNHAVRESRGEFLAFTDSDCMPLPTWLKAIEMAFQDPSRQIVMGPRIAESPRKSVRLLAAYESKKDEIVFESTSPDLYYGFTNNMGVRKSAYHRCGPFEERPRGADTIFVRRVVNAFGCQSVCYDKQMQVRHGELDSIKSYYNKMYTYGRSRQLYQHIIKTRPLTSKERLSAFLACVREDKYSWAETFLFGSLLLGGVLAWNLGALAGYKIAKRENRAD